MAGQKEDAGLAKLKMKKGWEKVTQVGQSIPMTLFMMWMTGNNVQIFSIMITVMTLYNAVVGFTSVNAGAFRKAPSPFLKKKIFFVRFRETRRGWRQSYAPENCLCILAARGYLHRPVEVPRDGSPTHINVRLAVVHATQVQPGDIFAGHPHPVNNFVVVVKV